VKSGSKRTRSDKAIRVGPTICQVKIEIKKIEREIKMYQENSTAYEDDKVEEEGSPFQKSLIG
jgi:hypothetical protein